MLFSSAYNQHLNAMNNSELHTNTTSYTDATLLAALCVCLNYLLCCVLAQIYLCGATSVVCMQAKTGIIFTALHPLLVILVVC